MTGFLVLLALVAGVLLWAVLLYNGLVRMRNMVEEAWSGIDVQLKRRTDLIPNLVATVKGYAAHEKGTLEEVIRLRRVNVTSGGMPPPPRTPRGGKGDHLGRSPGLRVWDRAGLPGGFPSGLVRRHSPLTVAGAAAVSHRVPFSPRRRGTVTDHH